MVPVVSLSSKPICIFLVMVLGVPLTKSMDRAEIIERAKAGNVSAQIKLASYFYKKKEYKKAFKLLWSASKKGNAKAQFVLGKMYLEGKGIPLDLQKARVLFQKSLQGGYEAANGHLSHVEKILAEKSPSNLGHSQIIEEPDSKPTHHSPTEVPWEQGLHLLRCDNSTTIVVRKNEHLDPKTERCKRSGDQHLVYKGKRLGPSAWILNGAPSLYFICGPEKALTIHSSTWPDPSFNCERLKFAIPSLNSKQVLAKQMGPPSSGRRKEQIQRPPLDSRTRLASKKSIAESSDAVIQTDLVHHKQLPTTRNGGQSDPKPSKLPSQVDSVENHALSIINYEYPSFGSPKRLLETVPELKKSLGWLDQAAKQGNTDAMYWLAIVMNSVGDYKAAEKLIVSAAGLFHPRASLATGVLVFNHGLGDLDAARFLFKAAAASGNVTAQKYLKKIENLELIEQ